VDRSQLEFDVLASSAFEPVPERRARGAPAAARRGSRPCWRTPPKLTPLAPAPQRFFSRSATVIPALRNATAAAHPAIPPADDRHVDTQAFGHEALASIGMGLTGGCDRKRPMLSIPASHACASSSAAAAPHILPWQRPMPIRVNALARFSSHAS
jgi:hypothetical protein